MSPQCTGETFTPLDPLPSELICDLPSSEATLFMSSSDMFITWTLGGDKEDEGGEEGSEDFLLLSLLARPHSLSQFLPLSFFSR
jgi:hypothetical protein